MSMHLRPYFSLQAQWSSIYSHL